MHNVRNITENLYWIGAIIEKRDSFTLSRVGLVSKPFLVFIILFLASPAIILILPPINK